MPNLASDKAQIFTVVPKELKVKLQEQADAQGRSLSNYVSYILEQMQEKGCFEKLKQQG